MGRRWRCGLRVPQLKDARMEIFAQKVAEGSNRTDAYLSIGYRAKNREAANTYAGRMGRRDDVRKRVEELQHMKALAVQEGTRATAGALDHEAIQLYERAIQAVPVRGANGSGKVTCKCGAEHETQLWRYDGKQALGFLDFRAKLAGLYVTKVLHGKIEEVEGSLEQIWERVAQMAEPLGREFKEWLIARWGYEVVPANLRVVEGSAEDVTKAANPAS